MKFTRVPIKFPAGTGFMFYPVEGSANYRSITIVTPYVLDEKGEPTTEVNIAKKSYFFEFFVGQEVTSIQPIQHVRKQSFKEQKTWAVEEVVKSMVYTSPQISDPEAVTRLESWLDLNTI